MDFCSALVWTFLFILYMDILVLTKCNTKQSCHWNLYLHMAQWESKDLASHILSLCSTSAVNVFITSQMQVAYPICFALHHAKATLLNVCVTLYSYLCIAQIKQICSLYPLLLSIPCSNTQAYVLARHVAIICPSYAVFLKLNVEGELHPHFITNQSLGMSGPHCFFYLFTFF